MKTQFLALLLSSAIAQCEILVTSDLNLRVFPAVSESGSPLVYDYYELDLNSDGDGDLRLNGHAVHVVFQPYIDEIRYSLLVTTTNNTEILCFNAPQGPEEPYYTVFATLSNSVEIPQSPEGPFFSWESGSFHYDPIVGGAIASRDSYLAVRIFDGEAYQYGWVHLAFPEEYEMHEREGTVFEYVSITGLAKVTSTAVELIPNEMISAGEGRIISNLPFRESLELAGSEKLHLKVNNVGGKICEIFSSSDLVTWNRMDVVSPSMGLEYEIERNKQKEFFRVLVSENME